jgi:translation initiation factor IF-2
LAKKQGIRINQLAKELGVESKSILAKLKDEGLGEQNQTHMAMVTLGLAESIRSWFDHSHGGTAVETAAPVEVAVKTKPKTSRKKKSVADTEAAPVDGVPAATPSQAVAERAEARPAPTEEPVQTPAPEAPAAEPTEVVIEPPMPVAKPAPPPAAVPVAPPVVATPAQAKPTAPALPAAAPGVLRPAAQLGDATRAPVARPTITLQSRPGGGPATVERRSAAIPAAPPPPKMVIPAPAQIQGPRVVREEQPDMVGAPRPRRPLPGAPQAGGINTARPATGRGVRVSEAEEEDGKKKLSAKGPGSKSLSARRRGNDGRRGEAEEKLREFTDADLLERRERLAAAAGYHSGLDTRLRKTEQRGQHVQAKPAHERGEPVEIEEPITVKSLSAVLGIKSNDIIRRLMKQGVFASVNQGLDHDTAQTIALDYGLELRIRQEATLEEQFLEAFGQRESAVEQLLPRPPVVTILGHVDHGKTSLLDKIRNANVAAGEAGGITQHTAAWMVELEREGQRRRVTFIDTPGHQAFTSMRARGANMTDIVVLVVSAAEGVQPQTIESINHARAAKVPIVVAMNKIDRADANPDMVLGQLAGQGLNPVEWGGDVEVIRTSATTGQGVPELLEILDYQAELKEFKADFSAPARGTVIEARVDPGLGSVATVLVQDGTLHVGDVILAGRGYGRIRSVLNDRGEQIDAATPSTPVIVSGLSELPMAGDKVYQIPDLEQARLIAEERSMLSRQRQLVSQNRITLDNLLDTMKAGEVKTINLIIKGDVQGSVETLSGSVTDYNTAEVKTRVIHSAVGGITESDVELAAATRDVNESTVIIGFNVVPDESARAMAEQMRVEIRTYRIIYEIFDDLKKALSGLLEPEIREKLHGHVEIRQVFKVSRLGNIAGCYVTDGHVARGSRIRLTRDGRVVTEDLAIESLKRLKDDVREVKAGLECGIKLAGYDDIKVGDRLEGYVRETIQRTL